jgi:hypothetical protein
VRPDKIIPGTGPGLMNYELRIDNSGLYAKSVLEVLKEAEAAHPDRSGLAPPGHQGNLKFTSTVVTTSTGCPLRSVGLYSQCLTASVADCTNRG